MKFCERCHARMFPNEDGDLACISCGSVRYASEPLPFLERGSKWDQGVSGRPEIKLYRDRRKSNALSAVWSEHGRGAA